MKRFVFTSLVLVAAASAPVRAADPAAAPSPAEVKALVEKGYAFLKSKQEADGSLAPRFGGPGIAALAAAGLIRHGYSVDDPVVAGALKYMESKIQKDGGIYDQRLANYTTSLAIIAFKEANTNGKYDKIIESATKFVRTMQQGGPEDSLSFGGAGYDAKSRPDMSNTQFFVEALAAAGVSKDDAAMKKAIVFISRSQNLPGEENKQSFAAKAGDEDKGGFVYNPADQDNAKSNKKSATGGLRSEGGMTYAGLKSFLYAGVGKDDPRVKAAVKWIQNHYTLDENPGVAQSGLYYYYHTFAKAMTALGEDVFTDAKGVKHPWKKELFEKLKSAQKSDGSWANANDRFFEGSPELVTAFAILSLGYCK